jgi:hypothetical protein
MLEPSSSDAPISRRAHMRTAEASFRARRAEIMAAVVRRAGAGDRAAVRLARKHGLSVEPAPEVLAARLAQSIERTRATVATLLAEGGIDVGRSSRRHDTTRSPATAHPAGVRHASKEAATLVNNNENTSGTEDGDARG